MAKDSMADVSEPGPGFVIDEYVISRELGHGSMATVYLASDRAGHDVAIKIFKEGSGISATMLERFRREAEATKRLRRHPYILTVYAAGQQGPYHYIAMENVVKGRTFEDVLEAEDQELLKNILIINRIATALDYAHEHGIVHRDVKPANIMMDEFGEPMLSDFGVCDLVDWPSCTVSGALTGTPMYMSPEQAQADKVDQRSDIYSLGVVMFEALTGELPYELTRGPVTKDVLEAVKFQPPMRPRFKNPRISKDLEYVTLKCLKKDPRERYPSAKALAQDLECVLQGWPVKGRYFAPLYRLRHFIRRRRGLLLALSIIILLLSAGSLIYRNMLIESNTLELLSMARQRSLEFQLKGLEVEAGKANPSRQAEEEIRIARREIAEGKYEEARSRLHEAVTLSSVYLNGRTAAQGRLEQARCETLLDDRTRAKELYREIMADPEASPAVGAMATFELITLLSFERATARVEEVIEENGELLRVGPFRRGVDCLTGDLDAATFEGEILEIPEGFQNDAFFVLGVHYAAIGKPAKARGYFKECLRGSNPPGDWPAPLAKEYLKRKRL